MAQLLPNEPLFTNLLRLASEVNHVIVHDPENGVDANYIQLLTDVLQMHNMLRQSLPKTAFDSAHSLLQESNPYVLILSPGNYGFVVAALSVLSISGAFAPLATGVLPEEMFYLLQTCNAVCILADQQCLPLAAECQKHAAAQGVDITVLPINFKNASSKKHTNSHLCFEIDQKLTIAPHRPALMLYTSGTSGPPKGVVHTRRLFNDMHSLSNPDEVVLSHTPPHWASGLVTLIGSVLGGARTEIVPQNAKAIWGRLREGGVTSLGGSPRFWANMRTYFQDHLSHLPPEERNAYVREFQSLNQAATRGSMPDPGLLRFWREKLGRRLHVCYGITELGSTAMRTSNDTDVNLERCIGRPVPGITAKLSNGDHGELLIKKSAMFSQYLNDEAATSAAFNCDGYYKTGDLAHRVGDDYVFEGRVSTDFIRYRGLRVPILETEMQLLQLPFISEGCILPLPDPNYGQRVAALVRLRSPPTPHFGDSEEIQTIGKPYIQALRIHLRASLPMFMLPTALRILKDGEEIPRTQSMKVLKGKAIEKYFSPTKNSEVHIDVEMWDPHESEDIWPQKPWDWGGLRVGRGLQKHHGGSEVLF